MNLLFDHVNSLNCSFRLPVFRNLSFVGNFTNRIVMR